MKYMFVADDEAMARWKAVALERGVSFADFLRAAAERSASGAGPAAPAPARKGECPRARFHRSGTYCKTCGLTPA